MYNFRLECTYIQQIIPKFVYLKIKTFLFDPEKILYYTNVPLHLTLNLICLLHLRLSKILIYNDSITLGVFRITMWRRKTLGNKRFIKKELFKMGTERFGLGTEGFERNSLVLERDGSSQELNDSFGVVVYFAAYIYILQFKLTND